MKTLIEKLATEDGSRELDFELFGWLRNEEHFLSHGPAPHYTTSLDAKLPWENIVSTSRNGSGEGSRIAWHEDTDGRWFVGQAKAEAPARRLAAMAAWEARKARLAEEAREEDHE